ncbi:MAG: 50S ribosomal protein L23 [Bacteroidales bacterium]
MEILIKPVITEKMTAMGEAMNRYAFVVHRDANKIEIKKAVEDYYGVSVVAVNTMNYSGKEKSRYTKAGVISGRTNSYKKAIVTLAEGETIDFYSNI